MKKLLSIVLVLSFVNLPAAQDSSWTSWLPTVAGVGTACGISIATMFPLRLCIVEPAHPAIPESELRRARLEGYFLSQIKENPDYDFSLPSAKTCCERVLKVEQEQLLEQFKEKYQRFTLPLADYKENGYGQMYYNLTSLKQRNDEIREVQDEVRNSISKLGQWKVLTEEEGDPNTYERRHANYDKTLHKIKKQKTYEKEVNARSKLVLGAGAAGLGLTVWGLSKLLLSDMK